ncbi:MAG: hypothetical protein AB9846_17900 [Tenuifilaceae bacterium]
MLNAIQHIGFIRGSYVVGVQASFRSNNQSCIYHLIAVKKYKGKVSIVKQIIDITSIEELVKHIPKNTPLVICIDGKTIIHKFIQEEVGDNGLNFVLPNANKDDFYVQTSSINDGAYISVIRREVVTDLLERFSQLKVVPALIFLGPFINSYTTFLHSSNSKLKTEFWEIIASSEQVIYNPISNSDSNFVLMNGEKVRDFCLPAYALSVAYLADIEIPEVDISRALKEDFQFKRAVWLGGWFLLTLVFIILVINFLFYSSYHDKYQNLNNLLQQNQSLLSRNEELKVKYTQKRRFIERSGLLETSRLSLYADRIARLVPDSVQLTNILIAPVLDKIRSDKSITFDENSIVVSGKCYNSRYFNNWKDDLKKELWVKTILINQFGQDDPSKPIVFEMQLVIK